MLSEPLLQYNKVIRPYQLEPLSARTIPELTCYDVDGLVVNPDTDYNKIAYSVYKINIRDDLQYAPHPVFARDNLNWKYHNVKDIGEIKNPNQFEILDKKGGYRRDFIYQIKRLAKTPVLILQSMD